MAILLVEVSGENYPEVLRRLADSLEQAPACDATVGNIGGTDVRYVRIRDSDAISAGVTKLINVRFAKSENQAPAVPVHLLPNELKEGEW